MSEVAYRVIERNGKTTIVDAEGQTVPPAIAKTLGQSLVDTALGKSYVYISEPREDGACKIGRTEDLARRAKELGVEFQHTIECDLYGEKSSSVVESELHKFFSEARLDGEWFDLLEADIWLLKIAFTSGHIILDTLPQLEKHIDEYTDLMAEKGASDVAGKFLQEVLYCNVSDLRKTAYLYLSRWYDNHLLKKGDECEMERTYIVSAFNVVSSFFEYRREAKGKTRNT